MAIQRNVRRKRLVLGFMALAIFCAQCGNENPSPTGGADHQAADVQKTYNTKCGICHGPDGTQQYAGSKDLSVSTLPLEQVVEQIKFGKGTMPPMNKVLDDATIEQVAKYAMSLRKVDSSH